METSTPVTRSLPVARALRTSLVASPPSICARIGSNGARGSLGEPVSRQTAGEVDRGAQRERRDSWLSATSIALRRRLQAAPGTAART